MPQHAKDQDHCRDATPSVESYSGPEKACQESGVDWVADQSIVTAGDELVVLFDGHCLTPITPEMMARLDRKRESDGCKNKFRPEAGQRA